MDSELKTCPKPRDHVTCDCSVRDSPARRLRCHWLWEKGNVAIISEESEFKELSKDGERARSVQVAASTRRGVA